MSRSYIPKTHFKLPKFKRGDKVTTPDEKGVITRMAYRDGKSWYEVGGRWYSELEINA
jgi:hypothetical protein